MLHPQRHRPWRPLFGALLLACSVSTLAAGAETPEQAAQKVIDATKAADWKAFASLLDPEALSGLRTLLRDLMSETSSQPAAKMLTGVQSLEELDKLSSSQVFERFMANVTGQVPGYVEAAKGAEVRILGHVDEKPDLAHVVSRNTVRLEEITLTKMEVVTLRRHGNRWRALLSGNLEGVMAQLRRSLAARPAEPKPPKPPERPVRP